MYAQLVETDVVERIKSRGRLAHSSTLGPLAKWMTGVPIKFGANREIYGEKEPADYVYELAHGAVRTAKVLPDGRRQIGGFYFAGDIFGLEDGREHSFSAEAITISNVRVIKRSTLTRMARDDREFAEQLMTVTAQEIARLHNHALMLIKTAPERLGSFLLEMAERISLGGVIELPMSRQDIADYLGITIETVSRTFTILESQSTIALPNSRAVVLRNAAALAA